MRDKVVDQFPLHLGTTLKGASVENNKVKLRFVKDGCDAELEIDHVIGATGFRVAISRLKFLDDELRQKIHTIEDTPVLTRRFESSVLGLYMVGVASANCFGPLTRFAYGAKFTARLLSRHLISASA